MRAVIRAMNAAGPLSIRWSTGYVLPATPKAFQLGHTGYKTEMQEELALVKSHSTRTDSFGRVAASLRSASSDGGPRLPEANFIGGLVPRTKIISRPAARPGW